jgi:transposase
MDVIYQKCCGVDVHKKILVACLYSGRKKETKSFGTSTRELKRLEAWLKENQCEAVAMESTASYWKPLYNVLEGNDSIKLIVANPLHIKNIPGRKTDKKDAEWIADLLRHGLVPASFIPEKPMRELREQLKYRQSMVTDRTAELNRLQKMLEGGNIKLSGTVSSILGMSGRTLLEGILENKKYSKEDIDAMFEDGTLSKRLQASSEQLAEDLEGILTVSQIQMMKHCLKHIDYLTACISDIDAIIDSQLTDEQLEAVEEISKMPGFSRISAKCVVAVIGTDMSRFPTPEKLCSWAGICPGNNESAGKRRSGRTNRGNALLKTTIVQAAQSASRSKDTFFAAQYERISIRRGANRAKVAVAHSMLIAIWHMLTLHEPYKDLGGDYYNQFNREKKAKAFVGKLEKLGYEVKIAESTSIIQEQTQQI